MPIERCAGETYCIMTDKDVSSDFKTRYWLQQYDISHQQQRSEPADTRSAELAGTGHQLNFFLLPFLKKKSLICLEGKPMTLVRETLFSHSSQQLPSLCLGPLKDFFELKRRPFRALDSPHALFPELQR